MTDVKTQSLFGYIVLDFVLWSFVCVSGFVFTAVLSFEYFSLNRTTKIDTAVHTEVRSELQPG